MKRPVRALAALLLPALSLALLAPSRAQGAGKPAAFAPPAPVTKKVTVVKVAQLTGPEATTSSRAVDVCGTDLGTMTELNGKIFFAFGDTFGFRGADCPRFGPNWRSNVLAATTDLNPADGIALTWWHTAGAGTAVAMVEGRHEAAFTGTDGEQSRIPTAMLALNGTLFVHLMSVHGFAQKGGEWDCNFSSFAYSKDAGNTWQLQQGVSGARGSNFNMLALTSQKGGGNEDGKYVYALGTRCGRFGPAKVARFLPSDILKPAAWRYYAARPGAAPAWTADPAKAAEVIPADVGEASIVWNPYLKRWLYAFLNEGTAAIEMREAPAPWGPWSAPVTLARIADYPQLYGAFMTPAFVKDGGKTVYFVMSQFGPYNTFVMKASLER